MKIKDTTAVAIFEALGFQTAGKWDLNRLQMKINKLPDLIAEDVEIENEKLMDVVDRILESIENGKEVIVAKKKKDKGKGKKKKDTAAKTTTAKKDKAKKKGKGKGKKKAAASTSTSTKTKKVGVIASIVEFIEKHGPISKPNIVKRLAKRFPDREAESMAKTVNIQVPSRLRSDKGIEVVRDEDGKYSIE